MLKKSLRVCVMTELYFFNHSITVSLYLGLGLHAKDMYNRLSIMRE